MENNNSVNFADYEFIPKLLTQIEKVIIGKHDVVKMLVAALLSGGHVLIEDVPGTGKTTLAMTLAKATSLSCRRVQFTPDVMASDITGFTMYNKESERFEYRNGLVMSNIFIADEINRTSPKTQSALLEAMEEKFFEMRKEWSSKMSFSKYLTNLIWQDTHNGALLYDPVTGDLIKENLK